MDDSLAYFSRVRLLESKDDNALFDIVCRGGVITDVVPFVPEKKRNGYETFTDAREALLIPSLSHSHIHLDKCFLSESLLELKSGDFHEALNVTAHAKAAFTLEDVLLRGRRLIRESITCGVTSMRAHVEVDTTVRFSCLEAALQLKEEFKALCEIQIAVFAQDPLFPTADSQEAGENLSLLVDAASRLGVSAIGSAPYVEPADNRARSNIRHILDLACKHRLHADFHLDYHLDSSRQILMNELIAQLRGIQEGWPEDRVVTVGHATALSLLSDEQWNVLAQSISTLPMRVALVGLPQSDLYMMGRGFKPPVRGTLPIPRLAKEHNNLIIAMAVNNVQNAFTPQGNCDPLGLLPLAVAVFQAATFEDCATLLRSVTTAAKRAIGLPSPTSLRLHVGDTADFVLLPGAKRLQDAVFCPPWERITVKAGRVVSHRRGIIWVDGDEELREDSI